MIFFINKVKLIRTIIGSSDCKLRIVLPVLYFSFMSKNLEQVAIQQLVDYLNQSNFLCVSHSANRSRHRTETLLLRTANDILSDLDRRHVSLLTLLDLSTAFNTIDYSILLDRLGYLYGISGTCLSWLRSHLLNKRQLVAVANHISSTKVLHYGVSQGSFLGPISFVHYLQPLYDGDCAPPSHFKLR